METDQTEVKEATEVVETSPETESESTPVEATEEEAAPASEDEGGTAEEEWLVPGRFRTIEDLKQSYNNLEAEYGRRGNELHQIRQMANHPNKVDPNVEVEQFAAAVKLNPVNAIRAIARLESEQARSEARQVRFDSEYTRLRGNAEFTELEPVMAQIAGQYNDMLSDKDKQDPRLLHILFYAARGIKQDQVSKRAAKSGQRAGEAAALRKTKAKIEGDSGTKGHVKKKFEELSLEDMAKEIAKGNLG